MDKVCMWCKHYKNGCCTKDNFYITDRMGDDVEGDVVVTIKEPESFYCSNWE